MRGGHLGLLGKISGVVGLPSYCLSTSTRMYRRTLMVHIPEVLVLGRLGRESLKWTVNTNRAASIRCAEKMRVKMY